MADFGESRDEFVDDSANYPPQELEGLLTGRHLEPSSSRHVCQRMSHMIPIAAEMITMGGNV